MDHRRGHRHEPAHPPGGCERQRPAAQPVVLPALESRRTAILVSQPGGTHPVLRRRCPWRWRSSRWHPGVRGVESTAPARLNPRRSRQHDEETPPCIAGRPCAGNTGSPCRGRNGSGVAREGPARGGCRAALSARPAGARRLGGQVGRNHGLVAACLSREPSRLQRKRWRLHLAAGRFPAVQGQQGWFDQRVAAEHQLQHGRCRESARGDEEPEVRRRHRCRTKVSDPASDRRGRRLQAGPPLLRRDRLWRGRAARHVERVHRAGGPQGRVHRPEGSGLAEGAGVREPLPEPQREQRSEVCRQRRRFHLHARLEPARVRRTGHRPTAA